MKFLKAIIASLLLMTATAGSAWADHYHGGHVHSSIYLGFGGPGPFWGPGWYYPPPSYYYPPTVIVQQPPVYVEQAQQVQQTQQAPAASAANNYWYYCAASKRYYPYVNQCPGGWQPVSPTPPGP